MSPTRLAASAAMILVVCFPLLTGAPSASAEPAGTFQVGVAKVDITPQQPVRMYGYASRKTESEGVAGRLKATALVIGSDEGNGPAVLLTVDNGSVPTDVRQQIFEHLAKRIPLKPERFVLANAHIHSGPDLKGMNSMSGDQLKHMVDYQNELIGKLQQVVLDAAAARSAGHLDWTVGSVDFAANRRVLKDGKWTGFGAVPDAPVDHSLSLLRVTDTDGKLRAVVVSYACHATTLRGNFRQIHGDWPGSAQRDIEAAHPGAVALITLGCGADSDPCPHSTVELCDQHGREVADEVTRLLDSPMRPLVGPLCCRTTTLEIPFCKAPPVDELREPAKRSWAIKGLMDRLERGETPEARTYPLTTWAFGDRLAMVFLSNEVVVDYAKRLRRELDPNRLWITAYANDVSSYIASPRIIEEGGYEARNSLSSIVSYGRPEQLQPPMEDRIVKAVEELLPAGFRAK